MYPLLFGFLHTFWVFFAIGVFATIFALIRLSVKNGLKVHFITENFWKLVLWGLVGARILSIIENYKAHFLGFNLDSFFQLFYFWDKGLNIWGAVAGFLIAFYLICKKKDQNFFKWLDVLTPSLIIGLVFGHLGAFFEGINYGIPTSLPWGVNFESPTIKFTVPIHPTQIYAFLYSIITVTTIILVNQNKRIKELEIPGLIGFGGITLYGFFSFLEEFLRGDDTIMLFGIRTPQIITLLITILSSIILFRCYNVTNPKKSNK